MPSFNPYVRDPATPEKSDALPDKPSNVDQGINLDEKYSTTESRAAMEGMYSEWEKVNGIEVQVYWDKSMSGQEYELQLPQIEIGSEEAKEYGVFDQVLKLGDDKDFAKKVFENVKNSCRIGCNVYEVYKRAESFVSMEVMEGRQ